MAKVGKQGPSKQSNTDKTTAKPTADQEASTGAATPGTGGAGAGEEKAATGAIAGTGHVDQGFGGTGGGIGDKGLDPGTDLGSEE